jgi:hypothetical protein
MTEFGYMVGAWDTTGYGVDGATQAKNLLNGLLGNYKAGFQRTFIYELSDYVATATDIWDFNGLYNSDGTPKPAADALHALTTILLDPGTSANAFLPQALSYSVTGLPSTGDSLAMQKSSGAFEIVVWNDATDWDPAAQAEVVASAVSVTVSLAAAYSAVNVYDTMSGTTPIATNANASGVQIELTDHPLIIELIP